MREISNHTLRAAEVRVQHTNGQWGKVMRNPHSLSGTTCVRVISNDPTDKRAVWRWNDKNIVARVVIR